jgi:endonuclease-3 related protein
MKTNQIRNKLQDIYETLLQRFGTQNWWSADTSFEVIVGAILTQQTSWRNAAKAIYNLKEADLVNPHGIISIDNAVLEEIIKPTGYFRQKSQCLKRIAYYIKRRYEGDLTNLSDKELLESSGLRNELLSIKGIGPETADSIILYAFNKPTFVVDMYTIRILTRLGMIKENRYEVVKNLFEENLPKETRLYKEFHALLVKLGKENCRIKPNCDTCPIMGICRYKQSMNS